MFQLAEGRVLAGKYALERLLARGGMGVIWVVRHGPLDTAMAAKFMAAPWASSARGCARFKREARAAAQLTSPHVVRVYDYGIEEDTPFLIMELLHGEDLGARLRRVDRLSPDAVAYILAQAGRGLRRAHDAGIVHRDLKPGNVFLARNDDDEVVKLLDFGVAKTMSGEAGPEATRSDQILGSIQYMSPEQVRSPAHVDHRTDLWALAAVAYRALTGKHPFEGDDIYATLLSICNDAHLPPSRHVPELPAAVDRFFGRAFAKDPLARFQTAAELTGAFTEAVEAKARPRAVGGDASKADRTDAPVVIHARANPTTTESVTDESAPLFAPGRRGRGAPRPGHAARRGILVGGPDRSDWRHSRSQLALAGVSVLFLGVVAIVLAMRMVEARTTPGDGALSSASSAQALDIPSHAPSVPSAPAAAVAPLTSNVPPATAPPTPAGSIAPGADRATRPAGRSAPTLKPSASASSVARAPGLSAAPPEPTWRPPSSPL
jgi:serine/threonine-protein kinase